MRRPSTWAVPRCRAAIGAPGEEDLYTFDVAADGLYELATRGTTDVYLKLYGPDSPTALIAEDDDSGYGRNAQDPQGPGARALPGAGAALLAERDGELHDPGEAGVAGSARRWAVVGGRWAGRRLVFVLGRTPLTPACNGVMLIT